MRRIEEPKRRHPDPDELDFVVYCAECGAKFVTWMGQSIVECPKCGKVRL